MNIEQLLPELKFHHHSPKIYTCQKCLNHNLTVARKNHKYRCPFLHCSCEKCQLVDKRRSLNAELAQVRAMDDISMPMLSPISMSVNDLNKERLPHCQRCAQHNLMNRLKGHKRYCPFRGCTCAKCKVVAERQRLMADQIKLRRKQKKQKSIKSFRESSSHDDRSHGAASPTPSQMSSTSVAEEKIDKKPAKSCKNINENYQNLLAPTFFPNHQQQPLGITHLQFPSLPFQQFDWRLAFAFCAFKQQQQQQQLLQQQQQQQFALAASQNFSFNETSNSK